MSALGAARDVINTALRPLNVQVIKGRTTDPAVRNFLPARRTVAAARTAGLSVGDYIDQEFAAPGATARTVDAMISMGGLDSAHRVCEIGPGSGRYAEKVIAALHPDAYEIYETAPDWLPRLRKLPNAIIEPCDGHTLGPTASASVDLVHANKVLVDFPFEAMMGYLNEMVRVARPGGTVAFDVVTEACIDDELVDLWIKEGTVFRPVPRAWLIEYLGRRGLSLVGSCFVPLPTGHTELLVFHKTDAEVGPQAMVRQ